MASLRKQKLVTVCSEDNSAEKNNIQKLLSKNISRSTKLQITVKAPINQYNLLMMEIYPELKIGEPETLPCERLNFISLGCGTMAKAGDIPYNFETEYKSVRCVDFTGHIGSMRLAFDLLKYFKRCQELVLVVNEHNIGLLNGKGDTFEDLQQYENVESVKIIQDFGATKKHLISVPWRLDEFLEACNVCLPNVKKLEVSIHGTGANFDKINKFIERRPHLRNRYSVEFKNHKVKTKLKNRSKPTGLKALPSPSLPSNAVGAKSNSGLAHNSETTTSSSLEISSEETMMNLRKEISRYCAVFADLGRRGETKVPLEPMNGLPREDQLCLKFQLPLTDIPRKAFEAYAAVRDERVQNFIVDEGGTVIANCLQLHAYGDTCMHCDGRRGVWVQRTNFKDSVFEAYQKDIIKAAPIHLGANSGFLLSEREKILKDEGWMKNSFRMMDIDPFPVG